jgi:excisionase family DNA binding protein
MTEAADNEPVPAAFMNVPEVATWLRVGKDAVYAAIASGQIPCLRIGRVIRVRRDVVEALGRGDA